MRLSRILVLALVAIPVFGPASLEKWNPLLAREARECYISALDEASQNKHRPALARLESLLLKNPVTVAVDQKTVPAGADYFNEAVSQGVNVWSKHLPDSPFSFINAEQQPAVTVRFVKALNAGEDLQGLIEAKHEFRWSSRSHESRVTATLYVVHSVDRRLLKSEEVSQVVAHELGHLLGLSDTTHGNGLMGAFDPWHPVCEPTESELRAVREFRLMLKDDIARIEKRL